MRRGRVIGCLVSDYVKQQIARRYVAGADSPELAAELGVNRDTVLRWVREAGEKTRPRGHWRRVRLPPLEDRFRQKYSAQPDGCWQWLGCLNDDGYGLFRHPGGFSAHRYSYTRFIGEIPKGLELDHTCANRACVNPSHLQAVTHAENIRRAWAAKERPHASN